MARRCAKSTAIDWNRRVVPLSRAGPESDYDVAVFLREMGARFAEMDRLADLSALL